MTASDPGMYGSAAAVARDLLYEVQAWLDRLGDIDDPDPVADVDDLVDALDGRLGPAGDAAVDEARKLETEAAAWYRRAREERAKVVRVEALHRSDGYRSPTCLGCNREWPCDTAAALAEPAPDGDHPC